jgi:hypothetical protein
MLYRTLPRGRLLEQLEQENPDSWLFWCIGADGGTRTRTPVREADFKSAAYTISPRPLSMG